MHSIHTLYVFDPPPPSPHFGCMRFILAFSGFWQTKFRQFRLIKRNRNEITWPLGHVRLISYLGLVRVPVSNNAIYLDGRRKKQPSLPSLRSAPMRLCLCLCMFICICMPTCHMPNFFLTRREGSTSHTCGIRWWAWSCRENQRNTTAARVRAGDATGEKGRIFF